MKKVLYLIPLSGLIFLSSCNENGRYVPFVRSGGTYVDEWNEGKVVQRPDVVYYMDTQTGKYYSAEFVKVEKKESE